jgi:hypothetical protein
MEFDLHQAVSGFVEAKTMVMSWESTFIAQVCATRSYRHPATSNRLERLLIRTTPAAVQPNMLKTKVEH